MYLVDIFRGGSVLDLLRWPPVLPSRSFWLMDCTFNVGRPSLVWVLCKPMPIAWVVI